MEILYQPCNICGARRETRPVERLGRTFDLCSDCAQRLESIEKDTRIQAFIQEMTAEFENRQRS